MVTSSPIKREKIAEIKRFCVLVMQNTEDNETLNLAKKIYSTDYHTIFPSPEVKGWVKVDEQRGVDVGGATNIVTSLTSPLKWDDMDWDEAKIVCGFVLVPGITKSGHKIEREIKEERIL